MSKQQDQTKQHFLNHADGWQAKAEKMTRGDGVIEGRMNAVLAVLNSVECVDQFLDVACGTGHLVMAAAEQQFKSHGIDFSKSMISICEKNRAVSPARELASFEIGSFFEMPIDDKQYDVISAQGFIEYISKDELHDFFAHSAQMLRPGGAFVIGSRNRLFNAFSMNAFTTMEMNLGVLNDLVSESIAFGTSSTNEIAIAQINAFEKALPHPDQHPNTQVEVETRYQYTPAELIFKLREHGFRPNAVYPINFHGLAPSLKKKFLDVHLHLSNTMSTAASTDPRLIPQSSTFVLDMRKI